MTDKQPTSQEIFNAVTKLGQRMTGFEASNQEILEAIQDFSGRTDERFTQIETRLTGVETDLASVKNDLAGVKNDLAGVKNDLVGVKNDLAGVKNDLVGVKTDLVGVKNTVATQVVTKDYLDQKLNDLKSELIGPIKITNNKINTLTNKLAMRKVLPTADISEVLAINPFPASR
jgi:archaellum component FlaC